MKANTTGLSSHALSQHQIDVNKAPEPSSNDQLLITSFFETIKHDTLHALCARLCAKDGLPFFTVANSDDIKRWINKDNLGKTPESHHTVQKHVLQFADEVKSLYKTQIEKAKSTIGCLSI